MPIGAEAGHHDHVRSARARAVAGTCFGLTVVAELGTVLLGWGLKPAYDTIPFSLYRVALVGIGALIASRQPRNPVGWIFTVGGLVDIPGGLGPAYGARAAERGWPGGPAAEWFGIAGWVTGVLMFVVAFLLTPTGSPPGRRWWVVAWAGVVGAVLVLPGFALSATLDSEFRGGRNPFVVDWLPHTALVAVGAVLLCGALVAALVSLAVRYRAAPPVERQQLKWVGVAGVILAAYMPPAIAFWVSSPLVRGAAPVVLTAVVLALGAAVLRYGLFQVDLVINRAVVYAGVSLLLAAAYAATAVVLGALLGGHSSWTVAGRR